MKSRLSQPKRKIRTTENRKAYTRLKPLEPKTSVDTRNKMRLMRRDGAKIEVIARTFKVSTAYASKVTKHPWRME